MRLATLVVAGLLVGGSPAFAQIPADLLARAESGDAVAQFSLGVMYATGEGVPENTERAYMWFSVAAAGQSGEDRDDAVAARDRASARLTPEQRSRAQALATTCFNSTFTDCGEP
jgi:TPR repeat protein